jgi:hypothetical protein
MSSSAGGFGFRASSTLRSQQTRPVRERQAFKGHAGDKACFTESLKFPSFSP